MKRIPHTSILSCLFVLIALLSGCGKNTGPYPVPDSLQTHDALQEAYVQSFLEGRGCEAEGLLEQLVEQAVRRDDFRAAGNAYGLGWKLHQYAGMGAPALRGRAEYMLALAGEETPEKTFTSENTKLSPRDIQFKKVLTDKKWKRLEKTLTAEDDSLYVSVYARKASQAALASGARKEAERFVELARKTDARQGWIIFLREDWKIKHQLANSEGEKAKIHARIEHLSNLIHPCR